MKKAHLALGVALALMVVSCSSSDADETTVTSNSPEPSSSTSSAASSSSDGTDQETSPEAQITIQNFSFGEPLVVEVGASVTVTNSDSVPHTWTSNDDVFDSGSLPQGADFSFTFDEAGEYQFFCQIHPTMTGSVTVEG